MRITNFIQAETAKTNLQTQLAKVQQLQNQSSSQKLLQRPSDDPVATAQALAVRVQQRATDQYTRNAADGLTWLTSADQALSNTETLMRKARDLLVQGASTGSMTPTSREAIATQLDGIRAELLKTANTQVLGRSVFAGDSDASAAFAADGTFQGTPTADAAGVQRTIGQGQSVRVDVDGSTVFGDGATSVFAMLDRAATNLRSGGDVSASIGVLDDKMKTVLAQHADVGARYAGIQRVQSDLQTKSISLESQRSSLEDVDLAKNLMDLNVQNVVYQSALQVSAKVLQPSLMDFLR